MFESQGQGLVSNISQNAPAEGFYPTMMLGNTWFQLQVPQGTGEVKPQAPIMPYVSPEDILYFGQMFNPTTSPTSILGGSNTGQQVTSGQQVYQDTTGTNRVAQGTILSNNVG